MQSCQAKTDCAVAIKCSPITPIDYTNVYQWIGTNSQKCKITYTYIDSSRKIRSKTDVDFKVVDQNCHFHYTQDPNSSYIYVYSNLFENVDKDKYNNIIGHHISIGNMTFSDGSTEFGFHSTIYNSRMTCSQYEFFKIDNNLELKHVLQNGQFGYAKPTPFLQNLWDQIKCGIKAMEMSSQPAPTPSTTGSTLIGGKRLLMVKTTTKKPSLKKLYKHLDNSKLSISMFSSSKQNTLFIYEDMHST